MMRLVLILALCSSCAATQRVVFKRCPTVYSLGGDVLVSGVALALGVIAYNAQEWVKSAAYVGTFGAIAMSANLSECER